MIDIKKTYPEFAHYYERWEDIPSFLDVCPVKRYTTWEEFRADNPCACDSAKFVGSNWGVAHDILKSIPSLIVERKYPNGRPYYQLICGECHNKLSSAMPFDLVNKYRDRVVMYDAIHAPKRDRGQMWKEYNNVRVEKWDFYEEYLASPVWLARKRFIWERDNNTCQCCSAPAEVVHHRTYARRYNEDMDDLVCLCHRCHNVIHAHRPLEELRHREG